MNVAMILEGTQFLLLERSALQGQRPLLKETI